MPSGMVPPSTYVGVGVSLDDKTACCQARRDQHAGMHLPYHKDNP